MNRTILAVATLIAAMLAGACVHSATTAARKAPLRDGVYKFSERPAQTSQMIEGTVTVLADTVMVDTQSGICRYDDRLASRSSPFVYHCDQVTLSFDRYDPVRKATYSTTRTVYERKQVCDQYTTNAAGQQVCLRYRTETTEHQVPVSGTLHPIRVEAPTG